MEPTLLRIAAKFARLRRFFHRTVAGKRCIQSCFPNGTLAALQTGEAFFERRNCMLSWAVTFFIVALIAAVLGFTGIAVAAAGIAKILFVVFLVLFLVSLIAHTARRV
jgi:uncharacterized membrane protein YtjA (UPF0391 family)